MRCVSLSLFAAMALLAGCSDAAVDGPQGPIQTQPALEEPGLAAVPFSFDATAPGGACVLVNGAPLACQYIGGPAGDELALPGPPRLVTGIATWEAATPQSEEVVVYLAFDDGDGFHVDPKFPGLRGPSPLPFAFDLTGQGGRGIALSVSTFDPQSVGPVYGGPATMQDVHVEGALVHEIA